MFCSFQQKHNDISYFNIAGVAAVNKSAQTENSRKQILIGLVLWESRKLGGFWVLCVIIAREKDIMVSTRKIQTTKSIVGDCVLYIRHCLTQSINKWIADGR